MRKILLSLCLAALACAGASADAISARIYSSYVCCNADGTVTLPSADFVGTDFLTINNSSVLSWFFAGDNPSTPQPFYDPFGLEDFGALFSGFIHAPTDGSYDMFMVSDDGGVFTLDGSIRLSVPGA